MNDGEPKRIKSELTIVALIVIPCMAVFVGFWILLRIFPPFAQGITSTDPADYPAARAEIQIHFPLDTRFFPNLIPESAHNVEFSCMTARGGQAYPSLELRYTLPNEDAIRELDRLQSHEPTGTRHLGWFFKDPIEELNPNDNLVVLGYLRPQKSHSRNGLLAYVIHNPETGEFYYEFNSD
ncbi:MAG: hypothetical protein KDA29_03030 [Phycisphaerales bacterium]|nr:hypothetical protein [Phycisphaerales bacterium]